MSITIMAMIFAANLEPIKKLVLLSLADHGSDEGLSIYPSIMTTSKRTGLSESTIRKTQSELEKSGILKKISTGGGRNTNHYKIDINKIAEVTPPTDGGHPSDIYTRIIS